MIEYLFRYLECTLLNCLTQFILNTSIPSWDLVNGTQTTNFCLLLRRKLVFITFTLLNILLVVASIVYCVMWGLHVWQLIHCSHHMAVDKFCNLGVLTFTTQFVYLVYVTQNLQAHTHCVNVSSIYEFTQRVCRSASLITKVLRYSALNTVMWSKYATE